MSGVCQEASEACPRVFEVCQGAFVVVVGLRMFQVIRSLVIIPVVGSAILKESVLKISYILESTWDGSCKGSVCRMLSS